MSEQIVVAVIGAMGGVVAASVPQIFAWYQISRSNFPTVEGKKGGWSGGDLFEIRELRLLRALVGEDQGRDLQVYVRSGYYRPALENLQGKGLVKSMNGNAMCD
ncbi:hypothetical protein [Leptodesmis sichuanensis]|uniref:hypothetical protein n=1 Tax=Leptodesmis sichuanensis TaxID=2906798 RepID=UPI001F35B563|nr:hypothetical protein [Leptodesmis sichuanensis]UIE37330.1 hypothetical protein KIK02_20665 [Leptodesmis sichuanensis A121]